MEAQGVALGRAIARSDEGAVEATAIQLVRLLDEERSLWRGQGLDVAIGLAEGDHAAAARVARDAARGDLSRAVAAREALSRSCSACHAAYDVAASGIQ